MDHVIKRERPHDDGVPAQPIVVAAWRGRFTIPSRNMDLRVSAHVSDKASSQIWDVTSKLPEFLYLEMCPLHDLWPSTFWSSPPEQTIALFFFPEEGDKKALEMLLNDAAYAKSGLRAVLGKSQLLVFTSFLLPERLHRLQGKPYFWGVFKDQGTASSRQLEIHSLVQKRELEQDLSSNTGNQMRFEGQGNPMSISINHDQLTSATRSDRRGRRLDDAWEHAKPLDELRQKAECKYCGFVSWHGGISRLKAHLGGGHPKIHLPGCDDVPPQVKKAMSNWFNDWLKTTKAVWTKEIREDMMPFNVSDHKTDNEASSFGPSRAGIPQFRVHLGGQELKMHVDTSDGKLNETKAVASKWGGNMMSPISYHMEEAKSGNLDVSSSSKTKKKSLAGTQGDKKGRPLDDAWKHVRALDEARQKTQCVHCGFISMYGGISRLKAHLGGGSSEIQLQGCPKVPHEVKTVMAQWFNEWSITSNAVWVRKCSGYTGTPKPSKKARKLHDMLEHAIPLDEMGQRIKCRYCGYVSEHGGIERMMPHLTGECPRMPLEVRNIIASQGVKKHKKKKLKGAQVDTFGQAFQEAERTVDEAQWVEKRHHVLQETLDEIRNTSLKGSLKRLLNEKSGML